MRTTGQKFGSWPRTLEDGTVIVATIIKNGASPIYRVNVVAAEEATASKELVFMESGLCHVIGRLANFDVGMNYTQDLIDSGSDSNAWLDWLYLTASGLTSNHRAYVEEMDSIAIPDSDTLESVTYTNTGAHSGKALLLWQAMIGYSAMTREEYDGL